MRTGLKHLHVMGLMLAGLLAAPLPLHAETVNLKADLSGKAQVPPVNSPATGTFTATYDTTSKKLDWKGTYTGLSGKASAAHFHGPADTTKSAGVALPIAKADSPFEGTATLTDAQAADLMGGRWYVNIHTQSHPGGEIRGQVVKGK